MVSLLIPYGLDNQCHPVYPGTSRVDGRWARLHLLDADLYVGWRGPHSFPSFLYRYVHLGRVALKTGFRYTVELYFLVRRIHNVILPTYFLVRQFSNPHPITPKRHKHGLLKNGARIDARWRYVRV